MGSALRFWRSIRGRSTLLAMLVVSLTLIAGSFVLLEVYEGRLIDNLDLTLEQQVNDRVSLIERGGSKESLTTVLQDEAFVWIGSVDGEATAEGGSISLIDNPVPQQIGTTATMSLLVEERDGGQVELEQMTLRVASGEATTGQVVVAGSELEVIDKAVADLARLFALAVPAMVLINGALAWFITGRALRPVDEIRARADSIGGTTLDDRVPVPDSGDEIEHLATTVNNMLDRLERHDQAIRQFSSDASHELKSPIANLRALVETNGINDPEWSAVQTALTGETTRLGELVDNLLFLSTHADERPLSGGPVSLDELLFAEAELVSATTELRVDLAAVEPVTIVGSMADLPRLVRNLVDNAARHADERIAFGLRASAIGAELVVEDDGPGVPLPDRERVFERFTRLDESRAREVGGTGLGLSIVAQIATAHNGSATIGDSALGGAAFIVELGGQPSSAG